MLTYFSIWLLTSLFSGTAYVLKKSAPLFTIGIANIFSQGLKDLEDNLIAFLKIKNAFYPGI